MGNSIRSVQGSFTRGDILVVKDHPEHTGKHWMICTGDMNVVHLCHKRREIVREYLKDTHGWQDVEKVWRMDEVGVARAEGNVGLEGLHLRWGSCEEFVKWCMTGIDMSSKESIDLLRPAAAVNTVILEKIKDLTMDNIIRLVQGRFKRGDILVVEDHPHHSGKHWMIYTGDMNVVHLCHKRREIVRECLTDTNGWRDVENLGRMEEVGVARAEKSITYEGLHLPWGSCEEFVKCCETGVGISSEESIALLRLKIIR